MEYGIGIEIKGRPSRYHKKLIRKVSRKFNVNYTVNRSYPSHVTLKYKFKRKSIEDVEDFLREFSKIISREKLFVGGTDNFAGRAVFLKVKPSNGFKKVFRKFILELKKLNSIEWDRADKADVLNNLHMTIAHKDLGDKVKNIKEFLKKYDKKFVVEVDNLVLIKKVKGNWVLHKKFKIKGEDK